MRVIQRQLLWPVQRQLTWPVSMAINFDPPGSNVKLTHPGRRIIIVINL